jgi:hypothetical protein
MNKETTVFFLWLFIISAEDKKGFTSGGKK